MKDLTPKQLAKRWPRYTVQSLCNIRAAGGPPAFYKIGPAVLYKIESVIKHEKANPRVLQKDPRFHSRA